MHHLRHAEKSRKLAQQASIGTLSSAVWRERAEPKRDAKARSLQTPQSRPSRPRLPLPAKLPQRRPDRTSTYERMCLAVNLLGIVKLHRQEWAVLQKSVDLFRRNHPHRCLLVRVNIYWVF